MTRPLGIIAGKGNLPGLIAKACLARGEAVFVMRLQGLADEALKAYPGVELNVGQVGGAFEALKQANCDGVVFAGYVIRPDFSSIRFDAAGQTLLPKIAEAAAKGDGDSLSVFAEAFQEAGFKVLGGQTAYPELLCPQGVLTRAEPDAQAVKDIAKAWHVAGVIGGEDIGQGCVVCAGLVTAVEAQEGTDLMLARAAEIDVTYQGSRPDRLGVLVKRPKPNQDLRLDLPAIGVRTVELAARAGLAGIGLQAGASIIVDRRETIAFADEAGVFIAGLTDTGDLL